MRITDGPVKDVSSRLSIPSLGIGHYDIDGVVYSGIRVPILDNKDRFSKFISQEDWKAFFYSRSGTLPSSYSHIEVFVDMNKLQFYLVNRHYGSPDEEGKQESNEPHEAG